MICSHPVAPFAVSAMGGSVANCGMRTECPKRIPAGKIVTDERLIHKDECGARAISLWSQKRPLSIGICSVVKYSGLTNSTCASCAWEATFPRISTGGVKPLSGGVALVDITCADHAGHSCDFLTKLVKKRARSAQVVYAFSLSGMMTDITCFGS